MSDVYKEFDMRCRQMDLSNIIIPKSKSKYLWTLELLQKNNIKCQGCMDDYNCKFEIRYE